MRNERTPSKLDLALVRLFGLTLLVAGDAALYSLISNLTPSPELINATAAIAVAGSDVLALGGAFALRRKFKLR